MGKKALCILIAGLALGAVSPAWAQSLVPIDPATVTDGHVYLFDNVTGTELPDDSANSLVGTLVGSPEVVEGLNGNALQFDGVDDIIQIPDSGNINVTNGPFPNRTIVAVFRCDDVNKAGKQTIFEEGGRTRGLVIYVFEGEVYVGGWNRAEYNWNPGSWISAPIVSGQWYAVTLIIRDGAEAEEADKFEMWLNGELMGKDVGGQIHNHGDNNAIGATRQNVVFHDDEGTLADGTDWHFQGAIDELWILNQALSEADLSALAPDKSSAKNPAPADESIDVPRDGVLSWEAGDFAQTHDVYLGTVFEDVNSASRANPMGVLVTQGQTDTTFDPERFEFGQTYYWRIDEVNGAPDNTIFKGKVWSFTAESLAYPVANVVATTDAISDEGSGPETTVDGSGLNASDQHSVESEDMWVAAPAGEGPVAISFEFDRAQKLHQMLVWNYNVGFELFLGYGFKEVTVEYSADGVDWIVLGDFEFAQASSTADYTPNTTVDFGGLAVKNVRLTAHTGYGMLGKFGLSEVRFLAVPVHPTDPNPAVGAADVSVATGLSWNPGREAASHDVYLSTDPNALELIDSVADSSADPGALDLATTYFWKIVEVNEAEAVTTWEGDVWNFATQEFIVVEDFESYTDDIDAGEAIFLTWVDGYNVAGNNSQVGYLESPFAEQTIVHGGAQAMPLIYDNTGGGISEATRTFDTPQDWSQNGVKGLLIRFFGGPDNTSAQMYAKINGTKVAYDGETDIVTKMPWQTWYIDLTGLNVGSVTELTIGLEGGAGTLFVDDILLTPYDRQQVTPVEPDPANLIAHCPFDGDAGDSTGAHPGTLVGPPSFVAGKIGQAISLNGTGDHVELTGYQGILGASAITVTAWVKTTNTETGAIIGWGPNVGGQRFGFRIDVGRLRHEHHGGNIQGDTVMNDGTWHHVAVTVEPNATVSYPQVKLWLDGQDDSRQTVDTDPPYDIVADLDVSIGRRPAANDRFFMGEIDELYIYDRVLSQAEIAYLAGRTQPFDVE